LIIECQELAIKIIEVQTGIMAKLDKATCGITTMQMKLYRHEKLTIKIIKVQTGIMAKLDKATCGITTK